MKLNILNLLSKIFLLNFIFISKIYADETILRGFIKDSDTKVALISSSIKIENTSIGTKTNKNGYFELKLNDRLLNQDSINLIISYTGYSTKNFVIYTKVKSLDTLNLFLQPKNIKTTDVVVSASKNIHSVQDIPITVAVLEGSFIKERAQNSLERILQYVPGVEVNSNNISLRGSSGFSFGVGSRVSLLLDGFPILAADNGDMKFDALPFYNIERIEVIKGSGSALFGTSAIGGIINILTTEPNEKFEIKTRLFSGFHQQPTFQEWKFGDKSLINTGFDLNLSQKIDNFAYVISGSVFQQQGYRKYDEAERFTIFSKLFYNPTENLDIDLTVNLSKNEADNWVYWNSLTNAFLPDSYPEKPERLNSDKLSTVLSIKQVFDESNFMIIRGGIYNTYNTNNLLDTDLAKRESDANSINLEAQGNSVLSENIFITYGVNSISNIVESITYGDNTQNIYSAYLQSEITKIPSLENLITTIGVRLDKENTDSTQNDLIISPKLGLNYKFDENTQFRFSAGKGFRAPSIAERFSSITFNGFNVKPNIDLKSELSTTFELGFSNKFNCGDNNFQLDISIFENNFENFIDPSIEIGSGNPEIQFKNLTKARIRGLEFNIKTFLFEFLGLETSLTMMEPKDLSDNTTLKYRSKMLWYNRLYMPITENIQFQADYRHKARVENIDELLGVQVKNHDFRVPINVVDCRIIYNMKNDLDFDSKFSININNVFNYYYVEMVGNMAPTRFINFQLEYNY